MDKKTITGLEQFTHELTSAICSNRNSRINNMAMLRALNAKSMPEILNQAHMHEATVAYQGVLSVLTRAKLGIPLTTEEIRGGPMVLSYDRFQTVLSEAKNYLLTINS